MPKQPQKAKWLYLSAMLSGVLLYASFFPLNLGFLAWIALVPLLFLVDSAARPRHVYLAAFVGGLTFYVPAVQWIRVAHPAMYATWAFLFLMCSVYCSIGIWLMRLLGRRGIPLILSAPTVWISLEYMRAHFPTGFSWLEPLGIQHHIGFNWYFLGYSQHDYLPIIQIADLAGVYGVTFLMVMVNVCVYLWVSRSTNGSIARRPIAESTIAVLLLGLTVAYGYFRLDHPPFPMGPRVAMLQCDLPQTVKMTEPEMVDQHMEALLWKALRVPANEHPDLVIWPETTCTEDWFAAAPGVDRKSLPIDQQKAIVYSEHFAVFKRSVEYWGCNQLFGLTSLEFEPNGKIWKYNSAKFFGADGAPGPRYDKMHLVPFGEYVPLGSILPWMKAFTPYRHDYSCKPGEHWTRFPLTVGDKTYQFGCIICYEDSDPSLARNYVLSSPEGPPVDFLVNISNDGWFNGTEEHEQHLAISRFRAIECRRSLVRAVNMGISGIIDSDGRIVKLAGPSWAESKKIAVVVNAQVPIDNRQALYPRLGDWVPLASWGFIIAVLILGRLRRSRQSS